MVQLSHPYMTTGKTIALRGRRHFEIWFSSCKLWCYKTEGYRDVIDVVLCWGSEVKLNWLEPGKVGWKMVLLGKMPSSDLLLLSQADWQLCSSPLERATFEENMHVASGSELFVEKQSISLKSRKEERIRGPCSWYFWQHWWIQLGAEVKCRAVIMANNRPKAEAGLPLLFSRHKAQGD